MVRCGVHWFGAVWYGASSGRPVGNSWSSSRCGLAGFCEARLGPARQGDVRYARAGIGWAELGVVW